MGQGTSNSNDNNGDTAKKAAPEDLYDLLGVTSDAGYDEIRKGFRKEALKWHPDKNQGSEEASKRFVKIQAAYDMYLTYRRLSDDQERAYYDSHRGQLDDEDVTEDFDFRAKAAQAATSHQAVRISSKQLMRFFDATLWNNDFSDDSAESFFGIYRTLYETISQSEYYATAPHGEPALSGQPFHYPSFGTSTTSYDSSESQLKTFYNAYLNFASRRSFSEVDKYRLSDAPDRRIKRMMEKENKRARDDARREYNDTIRNLTSFVKKRDPRFLKSNNASMRKDPLKLQQVEKERLNAKLREAALQAAKEREENAKKFVVQDWQKVAGEEDSDEYSEEEDEDDNQAEDAEDGNKEDDSGQAEDDEEEIPDWYCPACDKDFSSQGAWDNHERSKKHLKNVEKLKRDMQDEDKELGLSGQLRQVDILEMEDEEEEKPILMSKKEKKRLKKRFGVDLLDDQESKTKELDSLDDINPQERTDDLCTREEEANAQDTSDAAAPEIEDRDAGTGTQTPMSGMEENDSQSTTPQLSKKDKRRAREAAKKEQLAQQSGTSTLVEKCKVCMETFSSRSKLFAHIKEEGHAAADGPQPQSKTKGGKKGKR